MISWFKQLRIAFGASFLWLVCLIYFTQGFRSFVWTAVSYHLKDELKLTPSVSQFVTSIAFFPWSIKPLYGILSDCIPIRGRKRTPYLVLATLLSLFPWPILGLNTFLRNSKMQLMILLTLQNLGSAMADVVIDAMIAEAVRLERLDFLKPIPVTSNIYCSAPAIVLAQYLGQIEDVSKVPSPALLLESPMQGKWVVPNVCAADMKARLNQASFAGDLQSISWMSMALGGICGSLLGGYALDNLEIDKIFLFFSVLPTVQFFSCFLVEENSVGEKASSELSFSNGSELMNGSFMDKDKFSAENSKNSISRRRKSHKSTKKKKVSTNKMKPEKDELSAFRWFQSLKEAGYKLFKAFKQPIILRPMAWFFIAHVTFPNISTVMFYYQTEYLSLDASFLGTTRVLGWLGLMLGTFIYNRYLKKMKLHRILMWAHIGLALMTLLDMVLVSRSHLSLGISDKMMVLFGSALADGINQFKFMPFLILSGQLCPPGIEGTLFALFMSINNLGSTVGSFVGAGLASILNISSGSFDNLLLGVGIQLICIFIPVAFLFLIPKEATGIST